MRAASRSAVRSLQRPWRTYRWIRWPCRHMIEGPQRTEAAGDGAPYVTADDLLVPLVSTDGPAPGSRDRGCPRVVGRVCVTLVAMSVHQGLELARGAVSPVQRTTPGGNLHVLAGK